MSLFKELKSMPVYLVGIFTLFLFIPVSSLAFHGAPWKIFNQLGIWYGLLVLMTYWICPWLLCCALVLCRYLFLPFYFLQCVMLGIHCMVYGNHLPFDLQIVRFILVVCMVYIGMLFINKDFLYPFLTKSRRFWRKSRRFDINCSVEVVNDELGKSVEGILQNCSVTGLGVRIANENFANFLRKCRKGEKMAVVLRYHSIEVKIPVMVVWVLHYGQFWKLGFHSLDTQKLAGFIAKATGLHHKMTSISSSQSHLLELDVRQTAYVLWMLFIMLSFSIPAFAQFFR